MYKFFSKNKLSGKLYMANIVCKSGKVEMYEKVLLKLLSMSVRRTDQATPNQMTLPLSNLP